jgi:ribonucleoside-diphosphate reductase alpha chain
MGFEWANEDTRAFMSRGYLEGTITVEERTREIAKAAEKILDIEGFADKFYDYMSKGYYSLSSPVWSNFGTDRGLPISCNGVFVDDSIESMIDKMGEVSIQTKTGAGTSAYLGKIRPRGSKIKAGGVANGPAYYAALFETAVDVISQGSTRRGNCAVYLDVDHPDIMEFLEMREIGAPIQNLSLGVCITNQWMQDMIDGDNEKRKIWARILRKRNESGYPYLFFTDTVNEGKPQVLKDKDLKIWASNLCLRGDSQIDVLFPFSSEPERIEIETFVKLWGIGGVPLGTKVKTELGYRAITAAAKTGSSKKMIRITDDNTGKTIECTPDHQIFTQNRGWVKAKNLVTTDELLIE